MTVLAGADLIDGLHPSVYHIHSISHFDWIKSYRRIKIHEDRARDIFAAVRFGEEGFERTARIDCVVSLRIELAICLETVFKEVPAVMAAVSMKSPMKAYISGYNKKR